MKETILLDETGVVITRTRSTTPTHQIPLKNIKNIKMIRAALAALRDFFQTRPHRVVIDDFKQELMVFETSDAGLIERIKTALTSAQSTHVDNKKLVRPSV
jgi:hypothetical protein